jgi:hypothetical protein
MTNALSFRKESIQQSSSASASVDHLQTAALSARGMKAAHDPRKPRITTIITITLPTR